MEGYVEDEQLLRGMPYPLKIKGVSGLGLEGMCQLIDRNLKTNGRGFVILHAGANDIRKLSEKDWLAELECILSYIGVRYSGYKPVWSDMLPRLHWRYAPVIEDDQEGRLARKVMEDCRKRLQRRARHKVISHNGMILRHPSLQQDLALLDPVDGVHLTQQGQADFFGDFLNFIHNI